MGITLWKDLITGAEFGVLHRKTLSGREKTGQISTQWRKSVGNSRKNTKSFPQEPVENPFFPRKARENPEQFPEKTGEKRDRPAKNAADGPVFLNIS